jgi:hypothetical protein
MTLSVEVFGVIAKTGVAAPSVNDVVTLADAHTVLLPACEAVMIQVPEPVEITGVTTPVFKFTVQIDVVPLVKVKVVSPEVAVGAKVKVLPKLATFA